MCAAWCNKRLVAVLVSGQIISILVAMTGLMSTNLAEHGFLFPVLQSMGFYLLLSLSLLSFPFPLKMPVYLYAFLAISDMEANFLSVTAYQYTDITSILLLNSLTIPWVVLLSYFVLKKRYNLKQVAAVIVCLLGLGLIVVSDILRERSRGNQSSPTAWIGDLICVGSSLMYACQNVLQEYMLKRLGKTMLGSDSEYLGMLGLFGFLFSVIQWTIIERSEVTAAGPGLWTDEVAGLLVGFSVTMVCLYLLLTWFIGSFDASLFNMNILTSSIYGILLDFSQNKSSPRIATDWMYVLAYAFIVIGVVVYSVNDRTTVAGKDEPEDVAISASCSERFLSPS